MKINKQKIFVTIALISTVGILTFKTIEAYKNRIYIKSNYKTTIGKVINYNEVGTHSTKYVSYEYIVKGKKYTREINSSEDFLDTFDETNPFTYDCYCFWVIYDPNNPQNSLINLNIDTSCDSSKIFDKEDLNLFR